MSVPSACPHCQQPLPDGFIGKACPHCRGALTNKRKRSLSGFSFQAMPQGLAGSSRPPHASVSSLPPREVVEDRWDLPDLGVEPLRQRGSVPQAAPTGFPAVPSPMTAKALRSTMALGVQLPGAAAAAAPTPAPAAPEASPAPGDAAPDHFSWNLDHASAPPPRSSAFDVRALKQTALGVGGFPQASPRPPAPARDPLGGSIRKTAMGVAPLPRAAEAPLAVPDEEPEADAFPLVRITQPSGTAVTSRPPPALDDPFSAMGDRIEIPSAPPPPLERDARFEEAERPSQMPQYAPFRAPPSRRPGPPATSVGWWWSVGGAALVLAAALALRSAPLSVALRAAAAAASLLMLARFGGLSMRALLLLLVALPALAQEALSVAALTRAAAGVLTGALVLLPTGAWISADRPLARRVLLAAGVALTAAAAVMPGGVGWPWSLGAAPVLALALAAFVSRARWVGAALTAAAMAWAAACGASGGPSAPSAAASAVAMAALVLVCGRALAAVVESDD